MIRRFVRLCSSSIIALILCFTPFLAQSVSASSDINWVWANPYPIGNELTSITHANGIFVATGADGAIITSTDGETWDIQDSGTSSYLDGAAWIGGEYWCVGNGVMLNSTDGINWSNPNTGMGFTGRNIGYDGSSYVIPSGVTIRYSDDNGATWSMINLMSILGWSEYRSMYDIVWDGSQFVVIGDYGTVVTSPDGTTWTEQTASVTAHLKAIAYDGSTFVSLGNGGIIITSPDGVNWTQQTSGTTSQLLDAIWDGSQFVAVGNPTYAGENICVLTSPDGINWTKHDDDFRASFAGVAYDGSGAYVAVGFSGVIAVSGDGTDWDKISHGTTRTLNDVTWNGSQYAAVGAIGTVTTSPNGTSWADHSLDMSVVAPLTLIPDLIAVTWGNGQFVAVGGYGVIVTSPDGISWTKRYSNLTIGNLRDVIWAGSPLNLFIVGGSKGTLLTSPDGITWTQRSVGLSGNQYISSLAWNESKLIAAGGGLSISDRFVATSQDAVIWNLNSFTSQFRDIIWDESQFMAVESGMTIYTSLDGDTWTLAVTSPPSASLLNGLIWDGSQYTAVGRVSVHSSDGSDWAIQSMSTSNEFNGIVWNGHSQYVTVGQHGMILVAGEPYTPPANQAPVADAGGPYSVDEGDTVSLDGSGSYDPDTGDVLTYAWDLDNDEEFDDAIGVTTTVVFGNDGTYTVTIKVTDSHGASDTDTATVAVEDLRPSAAINGNTVLDEGQGGNYDASSSTSSPDAIISYEWDWNYNGITFTPSGDTGATQSHTWNDDGTYTAALRITDDDGSTDIATVSVTVGNLPPAVNVGSDLTVNFGDIVNVELEFTDPGSLDIHTATIYWGDTNSDAGEVDESAGSGTVAGSHLYAWPGTYEVTVEVTDDDGGVSSDSLMVEVLPVPETMVETLSDEVDAMELPGGTVNSLNASLDTAMKVLEDSNHKNDVAAINTLEAFINKIEAQRGKKIPDEVADELIAKAQEIITALSVWA